VHVAFNSKQFGTGSFDVSERFFGTLGIGVPAQVGVLLFCQ
jgi:hypothetical protein